MLVSVYEIRKSRGSTGFMNIIFFYKVSYFDCVLVYFNILRKYRMFIDVIFWAGDRVFFCYRVVLVVFSRYFEVMFSYGLRESRDDTVNF